MDCNKWINKINGDDQEEFDRHDVRESWISGAEAFKERLKDLDDFDLIEEIWSEFQLKHYD